MLAVIKLNVSKIIKHVVVSEIKRATARNMDLINFIFLVYWRRKCGSIIFKSLKLNIFALAY